MVLLNFETLHVIFLTRKRRYKFLAPLELAPWCNTGNPYGAIGDLALCVYLTKVFHFQFQFQVHLLVSPSPWPCSCPCPCPCLCQCPCPYPCPCLCQIKYGAMNVSVRHGNYIANSQGSYEVAQKLKGPLTWDYMGKIRWKISVPLPLRQTYRLIPL